MAIIWKDEALTKYIDDWSKRSLLKACTILIREIKMSMKATPRMIAGILLRQGRKKAGSSRRKGKVYHHPSTPYNPPAVDFGRLIGSISYSTSWQGPAKGTVSGTAQGGDGVSQPAKDPVGNTAVVGTAVPYGLPLEYGHMNRGKRSGALPRPFLRPAIIRTQVQIASEIKAETR